MKTGKNANAARREVRSNFGRSVIMSQAPRDRPSADRIGRFAPASRSEDEMALRMRAVDVRVNLAHGPACRFAHAGTMPLASSNDTPPSARRFSS
jgi:hypothetical protein